MRRTTIALLISGLISSATLLAVAPVHAQSVNQNSKIEVRNTSDTLRLSMDLDAGTLGTVNLAQGKKGSALSVELKGVNSSEARRIAGSLAESRDIDSYDVVPGLDGRSVLVVRFKQFMRILDETVVAYEESKSRWEIVLEGVPGDAEVTPLVQVAPLLGSLDFGATDNRLDLIFNGNLALQTDVSLSADSTELVVELPGVAEAAVKTAVQEVLALPPLVDKIAVDATKAGARITYKMNRPVDIVDTSGAAFGQSGVVVLSVVPDAKPRANSGSKLVGIKTVDTPSGVALDLQGVTDQEQTTFFLDNPPRLVVDLLGWKPEQVRVAAQKFKSSHDVVKDVVATDTRLGSARLVFALTTPLSLSSTNQTTDSQGLLGGLQLSLAPLDIRSFSMARVGVDFGLRRDLQNLRSPEIVVKPVQLPGNYAKAIVQARVGNTFRLMDLAQKAKSSDPKYQAALADYQVAVEQTKQAQAGYLPVVNLDAQAARTNQDLKKSPNPTFAQVNNRFTGNNYNLTITQPIVRVQNLVRIQQADLGLEQAQLVLAAAEQDLLLRVAGAYLNLLAAVDGVDLAKAEKLAVGKQLELARSRFQAGLGTQAQLYDTEARYSLTVAREIDAVNRHDDAKSALREIVGEDIAGVKGFKRDFLAVPPRPAKVDNWVSAALEQNLSLRARSMATLVAAKEIKRQQAGHLPTLDAFATQGRQNSTGTLFGGAQDIVSREFGARLNVPIFAGGNTSSLVREAMARRDRVLQEQEEEMRKTERTARASFLGVQGSVASLDALRKNVIAQESALQTKLEGFRVGVQSVVTVVDAYRLFFSARRDYLQARYDYLINRLRLKQSVGSLAENDLELLASLLE
ncbi:MAG: TolC family outer membrane protein [Limnobacter sp.]|uniref:TolC family outer membrane protein n=2 Tax=Pseudomonadota TaxID=1224 RepID=UPI0039198B7F